MLGLILMNDGRIRKLKENSKLKNKQIKMILLNQYSNLFGNYFISLTPSSYKKLMKIKQSKIQYEFLNGIYTEPDEYDLFEKIKYEYNENPIDIFTKIYEICVSEHILNVSFWTHSAFYIYMFTNLKLSVTNKNKTYKFKTVDELFEKYDIKPIINNKKMIAISDNKYEISKKNNIKNSKSHLIEICDNMYIPVNTKLLTCKKITSKISVDFNNEFERYEIHSADTVFKNISTSDTVFKLMCDICAKDVLDSLANDCGSYITKTRFKVDNKLIKRNKFKNKYYLGM